VISVFQVSQWTSWYVFAVMLSHRPTARNQMRAVDFLVYGTSGVPGLLNRLWAVCCLFEKPVSQSMVTIMFWTHVRIQGMFILWNS
jgi:hypothetical protein